MTVVKAYTRAASYVSLMDIRFLIFFCYDSEANNNTPFGIMVHRW
jgi:hypothetical protein